jgi:tetrapyrrole methylase family protein/MazG family protein
MDEMDKFINTIRALRDPQSGCPWNIAQTHGSLKRYLIEEVYECLEVIDTIDELEQNSAKSNTQTKSKDEFYLDLKEELGDLLLQILLHSRIAEEKGYFNFADLVSSIDEKMVSRHPHVFRPQDTAKAESPEEVDQHWEQAKKQEKSQRLSIFEGIPKEMPALARAWKISKKAVRESFEWDREEQLWQQLSSEIAELREVLATYDGKNFHGSFSKEDAELELGDILFTVVNIARWFKIDPEDALRKTNNKFIKRFNLMAELAQKDSGKKLSDYSSIELEALWKEAKQKLNNSVL